MLKPKITIIVFIVVLASSAVTAAPATAAGWMVNGSNFTTGSVEGEAVGSPMEQTILSGGGTTITCQGHHHVFRWILIFFIELTLSLLQCTAAPPCTLASPTILNKAAIGEATLEGSLGVSVVTHPATGTIFTNISIEGAECPIEGVVPLTGHITYTLPTGRDERVKQAETTNVLASGGELKLGSAGASLKSYLLSETTSHQAWSFL